MEEKGEVRSRPWTAAGALSHGAWDDANDLIPTLDQYWDTRGLRRDASAWDHRILAATAPPGQGPSQATIPLWVYTTIHRGNQQHADGQLDQAEATYKRALANPRGQPQTDWTRANISALYHQLGMTAQGRGRLDEADQWYRRSLAINEELGNQPGMALTYAQLGLLAEDRQQPELALQWNIRCVALFDKFPSRQTGTGPSALARLTIRTKSEPPGAQAAEIAEETEPVQVVIMAVMPIGDLPTDGAVPRA